MKLNETPLLACRFCEQGVHDACASDKIKSLCGQISIDLKLLQGLIYVCDNCEKEHLSPDITCDRSTETTQNEAEPVENINIENIDTELQIAERQEEGV